MNPDAPRVPLRGGTWRKIALGGVTVAAFGMAVEDVARVLRRLDFDYDLLLWGDDYFMTSLFKLAAGVPVYTRVADGNSTIYPPGGAWLHHAVLSPFGADTSLLANRVLNLVWLAGALVLATRVVAVLVEKRGALPSGKWARAVVHVAAASVLALAAFANPVTDSLHPANLELVVFSATALVLARMPSLSTLGKLLAGLVLPATALLAKQTAGAAVSLTLAAALYLAVPGSRFRRLAFGALPGVSLGLCLAVLSVVTGGLFETWAFDVLAHQPFDWWKAEDLYKGYFLLFVPALVTVMADLGGTALAVRRRAGPSAGASASARVASLAFAYAPFALAALFKTMGGPNNLAVVGFLLVLVALPVWLAALLRPAMGMERRRAAVIAAGACALLALQVGALLPRRRVQSPHDEDNARLICEYVARRTACGERVHLGRGSVCLARGGVRVPLDRLNSIVDATVGGRAAELAFFDRVASEHYDVLIIPTRDLLWLGSDFWEQFQTHYRSFFMTEGELDNDFWFDGWQGYVSWPMVFFERVRDAGTHHVTGPRGCDGGERVHSVRRAR